MLGESFAEFDIYVFHPELSGSSAEMVDEVVSHVVAGVGVTVASVCLSAFFDVSLDVLYKAHSGECAIVKDASLSVDDVDDALCLDGVGCGKDVLVDDFGIGGYFGNEIEMEKFVAADTFDVGVEIDGEGVVGEFLETDSDGFLGLQMFDVCHSCFLVKVTDLI